MEAALLVTGPCAVAVLADRFVATACRFVLVRPVVARVTAGAIGLERRKLPCNRLGVGFVTVGALQVAAVILRLVG